MQLGWLAVLSKPGVRFGNRFASCSGSASCNMHEPWFCMQQIPSCPMFLAATESFRLFQNHSRTVPATSVICVFATPPQCILLFSSKIHGSHKLLCRCRYIKTSLRLLPRSIRPISSHYIRQVQLRKLFNRSATHCHFIKTHNAVYAPCA